MKRALVVAVAVIAAPLAGQGFPRVRPDLVGMSAERLGRIHPALQALVDSGKIAGAVDLILRRGKVVYLDTVGMMDLAAHRPMRSTTLFRIASMSKAVTSVAVMMLFEEGRLLLTDPVSKYLPEFKDMQVAVVSGPDSARSVAYVPAREDITILDLLTHRSGITYAFNDAGPVGDGYRRAGVCDGIAPCDIPLAENVRRIAAQPLVSQPGVEFHYGLSVDVLGRLVEVVSGRPLGEFLRQRLFRPLGMRDTDCFVPDAKLDRLAVPYTRHEGALRPIRSSERFGNTVVSGATQHGSPAYCSGGAGLVSTAGDYARFLQMLLNGGTLAGARVLSRKSVELMTTSHTGDLSEPPVGSGAGVGLGFRIVTDVGQSATLTSLGEYSWGGIYNTSFWVDPQEQLIGVLMLQLYPADGVSVDALFHVLADQAIAR